MLRESGRDGSAGAADSDVLGTATDDIPVGTAADDVAPAPAPARSQGLGGDAPDMPGVLLSLLLLFPTRANQPDNQRVQYSQCRATERWALRFHVVSGHGSGAENLARHWIGRCTAIVAKSCK